jgi:hypothetical protein
MSQIRNSHHKWTRSDAGAKAGERTAPRDGTNTRSLHTTHRGGGAYLHQQMLRQYPVDFIDRVDVADLQVVLPQRHPRPRPPPVAAAVPVVDATDPGGLLVGLGQERGDDLDLVWGGQAAERVERGAAAAIEGGLGLVDVDLPVLDPFTNRAGKWGGHH